MEKRDIRKLMKSRKQAMTREMIEEYSSSITEVLLESAEYRDSQNVFCYVSFNQEVLTDPVIRRSLSQGKRVAVPKIINGRMQFYFIEAMEDLAPGYYGIPEPDFSKSRGITEAVPCREGKDLVVVPGLAFDVEGYRIGYGKGYYDRFFKEQKEIPMHRIALSYDFQVFDKLPRNEKDKKVQRIITNSGIINCKEEF